MRTLTFHKLIGSGAFGSVYLADMEGDRGFRRQVAVKVLHPNHPNADLFMTRVRDEARLLGLLRDENILEVLGLVSVAERDAVVMEYVEGCDLHTLLDRGSRPPGRALCELAAAVAGALGRAHAAVHPATGEALGVVHRDVKPANVMLTARGGVKLLDFGVARARFEARESRTGQHVLGTLNYMAPEYIITGQVTPAADAYGLALTLWEAVTGEPFGQPRLAENLHRARLNERLERVEAVLPPLVPLLRRMLAWTPEDRPTCTDAERLFLELADTVGGSGLRSWAGEVVPGALADRTVTEEPGGSLLGRTLPLVDPLGEASGSFPAIRGPAQPPPVDGKAPTRILPPLVPDPAEPLPTLAQPPAAAQPPALAQPPASAQPPALAQPSAAAPAPSPPAGRPAAAPPDPTDAAARAGAGGAEPAGPPPPRTDPPRSAQVVGHEGSPRAFSVAPPVPVRRTALVSGPRPPPARRGPDAPEPPSAPPPVGPSPSAGPSPSPQAASTPSPAEGLARTIEIPAPAPRPSSPPRPPAPPRRTTGPSLVTVLGGAILGIGLGMIVVFAVLLLLILRA